MVYFLLLLVPISCSPRQVLYIVSRVRSGLMYVSICKSVNTGVSMSESQVKAAYELVVTSPEGPGISGSFYLDGLWDEWQISVQLQF